MRKDEELLKDVQEAIYWEPLLQSSEIRAQVKKGIVTLIGFVDSYEKKIETENAAIKIAGVKKIIDQIVVRLENKNTPEDIEIEASILHSLNINWDMPGKQLSVSVNNGIVTLIGEITWDFQRKSAEKIIAHINGVRGIVNQLEIKPDSHLDINKNKIQKALMRNWAIEDKYIQLSIEGHKVTINGSVHSWYQKNETERIVWNAPGVWSIDNALSID